MENQKVTPVAVQGAVVVPAKKQQALTSYDENKFVTLGSEFVKGITTLPPNYDVVASMKALYLQCVNSQQGNLLEKCTPASIESAVSLVLINGWQPQKQQCYPVPMGDKLTILPSYHGRQRSAYNNGDVVKGSIKAQVIYKGDTFVDKILADGRRIVVKHEQAPFSERSDEIIGAYAICQKRLGNTIVKDMELMTWKEIQAAWAMSRSGGETHRKFPHEMSCKTVIGRLCKKLYAWTDESVNIFESTGDIDMANSVIEQPVTDETEPYDIIVDEDGIITNSGNTSPKTE